LGQFVISVHVLLLVIDKFPVFLTAFSILAHVIYSTNLRKFPFISLSSRSFIASCSNPPRLSLSPRSLLIAHPPVVFVLLDHYFFFRHFSNLPPPRQALHYNRFSTQPHPDIDVPTFGQVAAFFGICVWLVPFGLFVSLSAGELVLPTIGSDGGITQAEVDRTKAQGLVKQVYGVVGVWVHDALTALGWGTGRQGGYIGYNDRYR
jgi:Transmembrane adaptor Erv26